jgi:predicted GNAT family N-acyltransferase
VADLEKAFLFKYAQTPQEVEKILKLRLLAAKGEGRWLDTEDHNVMRDKWDSFARQIYCEVNGKIIAASRIVFNNGLSERSEHVSYNIEVPEWLWKEGFVEASRVCTDPAYRGSDVFMRMLQQMSHIVTQSGHRFLLMNCVDSLVPVYQKVVGVVSLKKRFFTPFMQKDALNLLYIDVRSLQIGTNAKPRSWVVNAPVGNYSIERGHLKLSLFEKGLRFLFLPLHLFIYRMARRKKFLRARKAVSGSQNKSRAA